MNYYSTNHQAPLATLEKAVVRGLAEDRGLYMPERIKPLPKEFFDEMADLSFQEIAYRVADCFFGEDVPAEDLRRIVCDTLSFDCPLVEVEENIYSLELFHGPTLAFKDVGARFMARLLQTLLPTSPYNGGGVKKSNLSPSQSWGRDLGRGSVNVLVATSGDTGSAVANGFLGVEGIHVYVLYPKGKVSPIQECQFTTLGRNITAIEVDGVFDDCQRLVKSAFMDADLNRHMRLTSANSINVARFLPQSFYYFWAVAQIVNRKLSNRKLVCCVPSGNFGNICSALFGKRMGLPVSRFIAANNRNDVFYEYLRTGEYRPRPSVQTLANAMDVGDPSNFARILDLYGHSHEAICQDISGATYTDEEIAETIRQCLCDTGYQLDPHGACGYRALKEQLRPGEVGFFLETAHPAKFKDTVERITGQPLEIPARLAAFMQGRKQSTPMTKEFQDFRDYLMRQ
ncbi:MAG: threonine synthase [Bacteroidaceae bacterium]|nr:threonine synthase [Bacteroidaceae bacterium]